MKKPKTIETLILAEELIHHIQSFMSGKEAARSAILSKSWYAAWLTRPTIDFDCKHFGPNAHKVFEEFTKKTMQRYLDLNLKIQSFSLLMRPGYRWAHNLIASAINMGATHLRLSLPPSVSSCIFPQEVLGSQTLVKLFLYGFRFEGSYLINCLMLKSLALDSVSIRSDDVFKDLTSRCISMEELSLSRCFGFRLSRASLYELHKLRRLFLFQVNVDNMFFTDFASRFPCLKYLTIHLCSGCNRIHIAATSLQTISFKPMRRSNRAKFDVPNIRKFSYSASGLPSHLSIYGDSSRELDISIFCTDFHKSSWFMNLKKLLNKFKLSRISLFIDIPLTEYNCKHEFDVEVEQEPLVVENLMIEAPPTFCYALLVRSFRVIRPKFITHRDWTKDPWMLHQTKSVRKKLIKLLFVSKWQAKFGQFGLKEVNMDICDEFDTVWRPYQSKKRVLDPKAKVRFQLIWEEWRINF